MTTWRRAPDNSCSSPTCRSERTRRATAAARPPAPPERAVTTPPPTPTHDGAQELLCDPPRDCRHASSLDPPRDPMFLDLALRHAELLAEHKGWPPRKPCSRSTRAAPGARHPRRRDWVARRPRKHQANDASGPRGTPVPHPEVPERLVFTNPTTRTCWLFGLGTQAGLRYTRAVHTGPTPTGQIAEPQPVPARIGRQPQPRSPSEFVNPPAPAPSTRSCVGRVRKAPTRRGAAWKEKSARFRRRHLTPVPRAASLAMLAVRR